MFKKKNKEAIIQILLLSAAACLLIYAIITNKVALYVHPRFFNGLKISVVIIILFVLSLMPKVGKARHNVSLRHYVIFVIPLTAALLFPATGVNGKNMTMSASNFSLVGSNQDNVSTNNNADNSENTADEDNYSSDETNAGSAENDNTENDINMGDGQNEDNSCSAGDSAVSSQSDTKDYSEKYAQYEKDGVMVIGDDIFSDWYCDLYAHLDSFKGKRCQYLAQVYSMDDGKPNQFLAGRYFMVCCIADLVGYGIVCESDERSKLKDDEWITVTGTIDEYEYNGEMTPILKDTTITKAEAPKVEYVYYNNN